MMPTLWLYLILAVVILLVYWAWPHLEEDQLSIRYVSEAEQQAQRDRLRKAASTTVHPRPRADYTRNH